MTLFIGVDDDWLADFRHAFEHSGICESGKTQLRPVIPLAAFDDVIDSRKGEASMV